MNQFIQRIANYVANEILIKGLANSKTFQKFAVRTESYLEKARTTGTQELNSKLDELHKAANEAVFASTSSSTSYSSGIRGSASFHTNSKSIPPPKPPLTGISGFLSAFRKEVFKDLGLPGK